MKNLTLIMCLLLSLGASAVKVKKNFNLVVEHFRGFNNNTLKLGTTNDRYFTFSGPGVYGLGNNDNGSPIFTIYKNSRISINYSQLEFFYPEYFDFNWTIVFKMPHESKFTVSDLAYKIDSHHIDLWPHRKDPTASNGYIYTIRFTEPMPSPGRTYYIERTVFNNYPFTNPLNIDTIYLSGHKMVDDGTDPEEPYIGMYVVDKTIKVHSEAYEKQEIEVRSYNGERVLKEKLRSPYSEFPLSVQPGFYWAAIFEKNEVVYYKNIYIY